MLATPKTRKPTTINLNLKNPKSRKHTLLRIPPNTPTSNFYEDSKNPKPKSIPYKSTTTKQNIRILRSPTNPSQVLYRPSSHLNYSYTHAIFKFQKPRIQLPQLPVNHANQIIGSTTAKHPTTSASMLAN